MMGAIGAILLLVTAFLGLRSLKLTKQDIKTRSEREAKVLAINCCEHFAREIIPRNKVVLEKIAEHSIAVFVTDPDEVTFEEIPREEVKRAHEWIGKLPEDLLYDILALMNEIEAWATYFVHRVADGDVAFGPCAPPYCSFIVQNYAFVVFARNYRGSGDYPNAVTLFLSWRERLENAKTGHTIAELLDRLEDLQSRTVLKHDLGKPLGTDIEG